MRSCASASMSAPALTTSDGARVDSAAGSLYARGRIRSSAWEPPRVRPSRRRSAGRLPARPAPAVVSCWQNTGPQARHRDRPLWWCRLFARTGTATAATPSTSSLSSTLHPRATIWSNLARSASAVVEVFEAIDSKGAAARRLRGNVVSGECHQGNDAAPAWRGSIRPGPRSSMSTAVPSTWSRHSTPFVCRTQK